MRSRWLLCNKDSVHIPSHFNPTVLNIAHWSRKWKRQGRAHVPQQAIVWVYDMMVHNDNCVQPHTTNSVVVRLQQVSNDDKYLAISEHLNEQWFFLQWTTRKMMNSASVRLQQDDNGSVSTSNGLKEFQKENGVSRWYICSNSCTYFPPKLPEVYISCPGCMETTGYLSSRSFLVISLPIAA